MLCRTSSTHNSAGQHHVSRASLSVSNTQGCWICFLSLAMSTAHLHTEKGTLGWVWAHLKHEANLCRCVTSDRQHQPHLG